MEYPTLEWENGPRYKAIINRVKLKMNLCVYRYEIKIHNWEKHPRWLRQFIGKKIDVQQGFCTEDAFEKFINQTVGYIKPLPLILTTRKELENCAKYGFVYKDRIGPKEVLAYDEYVRNGLDLDLVVTSDINSHLIFDSKGIPRPVAQHFDYIDAGMHNANYDLAKALKILNENPRVRFSRNDLKYPEPGIGTILDIPYYNKDEDRQQYLEFFFEPTQDEVEVLWENQLKLHPQYPSTAFHEAVFNLDLLGLKRGGAALKTTFY